MALELLIAKLALVAKELVPDKDPVNDPVNEEAVTLDKMAADPEVISFFQFGIYFHYGWLLELSSPLPFRAYNILINIIVLVSCLGEG